MFNVKLQTVTPDAEKTIAYIARVSNPNNQDNPDYAKLLKYCIRKKHWSVFESSYMTLEIEAPLAIITQILRHRSFTFQSASFRYQSIDNLNLLDKFYLPKLRRQDKKNRQNSIDDLPDELNEELQQEIHNLYNSIELLYTYMIENEVAKEVARFILPQATMSRLYMTGNIRSWIHYIELRTDPSTQLEHREVANKCKEIFIEQFPIVSEALEWR